MSISTSMDSVPTHGGMVIVGAGECGTRAAFALREKGWGGQITVIGAEEFHAYERPPLSKSTMVGDNPDPVHPYALDDFRNARIRLLRSTLASKIKPRERRIVLEDGSHLGYTNLLLAAGCPASTIFLLARCACDSSMSHTAATVTPSSAR